MSQSDDVSSGSYCERLPAPGPFFGAAQGLVSADARKWDGISGMLTVMNSRDDDRYVHVEFQVDANRVNARGKLEAMNQLERWYRDGVIAIQMSEVAQAEAARGDRARASKAHSYIFSQTLATTDREQQMLERIASILFPGGIRSVQDTNDVEVVFNAFKYECILVTADGDSKSQPRGILGSRGELKALGVRVLTAEEAVAYVRARIAARDERIRRDVARSGRSIPSWVGSD
jgi:hypothetical protein